MKRTIPDGDPVLSLTDAESDLHLDFVLSYNRTGRKPLTPAETEVCAALICFLRDPRPDYTGKVVEWSTGGKTVIADCLRQDGDYCQTTLWRVHVSRVREHISGTVSEVNWPPANWPPGARLTGVR